jgi:hypothetical protein
MVEDNGRIYETTNDSDQTMFRSRPEVAQRSEAMRHAQSSELGFDSGCALQGFCHEKAEGNPFKNLG